MVKAEMYFFYRLDDNETIFNTLLPRFLLYVYLWSVKTLSRGKTVSSD